jgi:hypothetical protein
MDMDVIVAGLGKWQDTATNRGFAAGLFEGDSVPCRGDRALNDRLRLNQGKSRWGLGLKRGESDMRSKVLLVAEDRDLGVEEGWQERLA